MPQCFFNLEFYQSTIVKAHLVLHYPAAIRMYGTVHNFCTESFEMAHKENAKKPARRVNWQSDMHRQILTHVSRSEIMATLRPKPREIHSTGTGVVEFELSAKSKTEFWRDLILPDGLTLQAFQTLIRRSLRLLSTQRLGEGVKRILDITLNVKSEHEVFRQDVVRASSFGDKQKFREKPWTCTVSVQGSGPNTRWYAKVCSWLFLFVPFMSIPGVPTISGRC